MATFNFNIPNSLLSIIIEDFSLVFDYNNTKLEEETEGAFAKRMLLRTIKNQIRSAHMDALVMREEGQLNTSEIL
jgi:hypothetical protein